MSKAHAARASVKEVAELRARLAEAEETLEAIRNGDVDAIAVDGPRGRQIFTLQSADQPYRVLAERMNEGAASINAEGTILFCNERLAQMAGQAPEKLVGSQITALIARDGQGAFQELLAKGLESEARGEAQLQRGDGSLLPVLASLKAIPAEQGLGLCLVATDLSERKRVEEALAGERQKFNAILDNLSPYVVLLTADYRVAFANREFRQRFGEHGGRRCFEFLFNRSEPCEVCHTYEVLKTGQRVHWEWTGPDNRNYDIHDFPFSDTDGSRLILEMGIDVTEQKRAEAKLQEASRYARNLIEASLDPLVTISRGGKITDVNVATEEVTGVARERLIGSDFSDYFTDPEKARQGFQQVFAEGFGRDYPLAIRHTSGRVTEVLYNASVLRNDRGEIEGVFAAARDITELKHLEEQLAQSRKVEVVGRLAGGIAHEFNNLLAIILGNVEIAEEKLGPELALSKYLAAVRKAAGRASGLTRQLLAFSRKQVMQPVVLNLNDTVNEAARMVRRLIPENIELDLQLAGDLGMVKVDPMQIDQVLMNLVLNARDAMPKGGRLKISTANVELDGDWQHSAEPVIPGNYVMLSVSDTGMGMDEETIAHVFEPFFTTKGPGEGTGLGLSIIDGIVKQSSGYVWVYSRVGKGTTFKIFLPRVREASEVELPEEQHNEAEGGSETILVVEDEPDLAEIVRGGLGGSGYNILSARSGEEALQLAAGYAGPIDLLLTDVILKSAMDGVELADRLRAVRPGIKVIYMSGYSDALVRTERPMNSGAMLLEKPIPMAMLRRKVRDVLGTGRVGIELTQQRAAGL